MKKAGRLTGVDMFRVFAFMAVVLIHTAAYQDADNTSFGQIIVALCRFAVPYFFIASGYFLGDKSFLETTVGMAKRLLPIFFAWALFYCWFFSSLDSLKTVGGFAKFLYTGLPGYHLWFLPALGLAVAIFAAARTQVGWYGLFALAALFYLVGMAFGPWHTLLGLPSFGGRNGPSFAPMFVTIGAWWKAKGPIIGSPWGSALLVVAAIVGVLLENTLLLRVGATTNIAGPDFALMSVPYASAVFALAISWQSGRLSDRIAKTGAATLGMYLIHIWILVYVQRSIPPMSLGLRLTDAVLVIGASILAAVLLLRVPVIRRLVK